MSSCGTTEIQEAISNGKSPIQSRPKAQIALFFTSPEASAIMKIGTNQAWIHGKRALSFPGNLSSLTDINGTELVLWSVK